MECLLDTGALRNRMSAELAPLAGIELTGALTEEFYIGGLRTAGALARVNLTVTDGTDEFSWDAPVWFCDPWPHPFGLAGLRGLPVPLPGNDPRLRRIPRHRAPALTPRARRTRPDQEDSEPTAIPVADSTG